MSVIVHIAEHAKWDSEHPWYVHESLEAEGFIHCSSPDQVLGPANRYFKGKQTLLLLLIDEQKVTSRIEYEDTTNSGVLYPHIYGPLNTSAVITAIDFPCDENGAFRLPDAVSQYLQSRL